MLTLLLAACTDEVDKVPAVDAPTFEDADGASLSVGDDGALLVGGRTFRVSFGFVNDVEETVNYDPWNLYDPDQADAVPSGFEYVEVEAAAWDGDAFALTLANGEAARLVVDDAGPGLRITVSTEAAEAPYVRVLADVSGEEAFYGLGEWFDGAEHRGHAHPMHMVAQFELESGYNEAHVPVPLLVSSDGWGLLVDSYLPGVFDVAATDATRAGAVFLHDGSVTFDVYTPGRPRDVVARYHARTGAPEIPPDWAFAPLQWRDDDIHAEDLVEDAAALRELGIPTGCVWIDNPWQTLYNSMEPDPARFPDWDGLMDSLEARGFRMLAWTTPYVEDADPDHDTYEANGWFVDAPLLFSDFGDMVDLTHPDAASAWTARADAAWDNRIVGWKLDYGEDIQVGLGAARTRYGFADGSDERSMHHRYVLLYHDAYDHDGDAFLLGRTGVLRGHTITDAIWPGDIDSDFRVFGEDDHVGGLPSAIRAGNGLAASGYPFFASDTGGYRHDRPTHEVMVRWTEYAALLPIFQYGGSGVNHNPWDYTPYGESVFTEDTLTAFKRYAVLHTRLFPYFKLLAERADAEGMPFAMALGLAYPELGVHPEDAFLLGDDVYVSPVEVEGATSKAVVFPPGGWVHWWTGEAYEGEAEVPAPLGEGPLFQRVGSAVPMLRPTVMTLATTDGSVDSWADDPGRLYVRLVPGEGAGFTLATGETVAQAGDDVTLTAGALYGGWDVELWLPDGGDVTWNGAALPAGEDGCTDCVIAGDPWSRIVVDGEGVLSL